MGAQCEILGKKLTSGHKVSHSQVKTKRTFKPNLNNVSFYSDALKASLKFRVAASTVRTIDKNGGIDSFLLGESNRKLTETAKKFKKKIIKALEGNPVIAERIANKKVVERKSKRKEKISANKTAAKKQNKPEVKEEAEKKAA